MKALVISGILFVAVLFLPVSLEAGSGTAGITPGTGFDFRTGSGRIDWMIPITIRGEYQLGGEEQHGVGAEFGGKIWTGFKGFNTITFTPYYHHYFNGGAESGPYVGAILDLGFRRNFNMIGIGGVGGYQHMFNDFLGIYGEGRIGFSTFGTAFSTGRSNAVLLGLQAGALFHF